MKKIISKITVSVLLLAGVLIISAEKSYTDGLSGYQIAKKAKYANRPNSSISKSVMILQTRSGGGWKTVDTRTTAAMSVIWSGSGQNSLTRSLFRFTSGLKKDVTSLSMEQVDRIGVDDIQYTYLPSLRRPRRVSSSERQNDFEDTDFTNEDLGGIKVSDYTYKRLGDETYRGLACYVIERFPRNRGNAKYAKHKAWIAKKYMVPIKVEGYDMSMRLKKKMYARNIRRYANIWVAMYIKVINVQSNHQTISKINYFKVNARVRRSLFNSAQMDAVWGI
jgi:hypothetical protein